MNTDTVPIDLLRKIEREKTGIDETGEYKKISAMFVDMRGFSHLLERHEARRIIKLMDLYFRMLVAVIRQHDGVVDKFMGDGLMAFWGAPERLDDPALRACRAALAMARAIEADNQRRAAVGDPPVWIRIGIHTGTVVVGDIGAPGRINYTIVGDTVNAGQRLEALGHDMGRAEAVTILVSEAVRRQLPDGFVLEPAGSFRVRGKAEVIEVYRLTGGPAGAPGAQA